MIAVCLFNNASSAVDIVATMANNAVTSTPQKLLKDVVVDCLHKKKTPQTSSIDLRARKVSRILVHGGQK